MKNNLVRNLAYPAIDGLRFFAALAVFFEHVIGELVTEYFGTPMEVLTRGNSPWWNRLTAYFQDGNHGVDIFFIISGFLMSRIVLSSGSRFSYSEFIGKRVKRIYPAFFVSLCLAAFIHCYFFGWQWTWIDFAKDAFFLNAIPGYKVIPYNFVSWSLGYEFAFYLVIPALLLLCRYLDRRIAAFAMLMCSIVFMPTDLIRMNGLFVGALAGAMNDDFLKDVARKIHLAPIIVAYLACGVLKATVLADHFIVYYATFIACSALAFVKIVWDSDNLLARFFSSGPLRKLGTLSYSIYLFHTLVAAVVLHYLTPWPASLIGVIWCVAATAVITLAVSYLSYSMIEVRYFNRAKSVHRRNGASAAVSRSA